MIKYLFHQNYKTMKANDRDNDMLKNENTEKTMNEGNSVPNIHPVAGQEVTEEKAQAGLIGGVKPAGGGRYGSVSHEDGGQDTGSSAGSH
jgi:hypothetical protein